MVQKAADPSKRDTVVLLLQDMLEVVTRDMMVNENRLVYSSTLKELHSTFLSFYFYQLIIIVYNALLNISAK